MSSRILVLCATARGHAFVERLFDLQPDARFTVCSFPEEKWEPAFLESIKTMVEGRGHRFLTCRDVGKTDVFAEGEFDLMFSVSWRYMIPRAVFGRIRRGAFVFHDSLLPRYRGFSPTVWSIINGEPETGVTLFEMADSVDNGRLVDQLAVKIEPDEYIDSVVRRVSEAYLALLDRNLNALLDGRAVMKPQDESFATYTCRRTPRDNRVDWRRPARDVFNLIRASSKPYPGAYCFFESQQLTIWSAKLPSAAPRYVGVVPGRVIERIKDEGALVLAGDFPVFIHEVQLEGGQIVTADAVLKSVSQTLT